MLSSALCVQLDQGMVELALTAHDLEPILLQLPRTVRLSTELLPLRN